MARRVLTYSGWHRVNTNQDVATMRAGALSAGLTKQEVTAHLVYCSGFHGIMGKYKVFWDSKFNPNMDGGGQAGG